MNSAVSLFSMPKPMGANLMKYQIAMPGQTLEFSERAVVAELERLGFKQRGTSKNPRQRPELYGQRRFEGLCGPMWGGEGCIRHETVEVYAENSRD